MARDTTSSQGPTMRREGEEEGKAEARWGAVEGIKEIDNSHAINLLRTYMISCHFAILCVFVLCTPFQIFLLVVMVAILILRSKCINFKITVTNVPISLIMTHSQIHTVPAQYVPALCLGTLVPRQKMLHMN